MNRSKNLQEESAELQTQIAREQEDMETARSFIETQIEEYTQEQFALLDFVNYNPRCLIKGSAGTGKTLMALEIARRKSLEDIKIGLFCYNNRLGDKLNDSIQKMKLNKNRVIYSGTLHKYMKNHINIKNANHIGEPHKYFSEELPMEFLISNVDILEENKFDVLVLDEAQDLISPYFLEVFDLILKGGISNGNWIMFGDFSNQAIYLNNAANILELLNTYSSYTRFPPLKINCRNTKKIASQNTLLTGSELPEFTSKNEFGNNVISKYPNSTQQAIIIEEILQEIRNRKIPLNKVTLLSPKKMENSVIGNHYPILELIKKGVKTSTIQAYKGLENTIIVLYDFEEITSDKMKSLLYVGISRAKQELYIVLDKKLKVSVENLIEENYAKLNIHGNKR